MNLFIASDDGPAPPVPDPLIANVKFGCNFQGTNGQTTATDFSASARAINFLGDAAITTSQSAYGLGSSLYLDGITDCVYMPASTDWAPGNAVSWCWEVLCKQEVESGTRPLIGQAIGTGLYPISIRNSGTDFKVLAFDGGGSLQANETVSGVATQDVWRHVAVAFDVTNGKLYAYYDGIKIIEVSTWSSGLYDPGQPQAIGAYSYDHALDAAGDTWKGWIQWARFTVGNPRYPGGTTFTPIHTALPTV